MSTDAPSLFDAAAESGDPAVTDPTRPLADRLRPRALDDVVGQDHLLAPDAPLGRMVEAGRLSSIILWGPPGCGKTTIARLLAARTGLIFEQISATFSGVADLRKVFTTAARRHELGQGTLLFVDEIHRFNRAQQDSFLPYVEDGTVVLVGATTENPSFELNGALLSRCQVLVLRRLDDRALAVLLARAEAMAGGPLPLTEAARAALIIMADGDGRYLLSMVEQIVGWARLRGVGGRSARGTGDRSARGTGDRSARGAENGSGHDSGDTGTPERPRSPASPGAPVTPDPHTRPRSLANPEADLPAGADLPHGAEDRTGADRADAARETGDRAGTAGTDAAPGSRALLDAEDLTAVVASRSPLYDKSGEEHYNLISALHKSMRGSDPDAALYWLARMLGGGEDPLYVVRRLVRFASEDVGMADPGALQTALAAWDAYERLGSPEGELAIAQAVVHLATAPKSIAVYRGLGRAQRAAQQTGSLAPPAHILNAPTRLMKELGYGAGYQYDPDTADGFSGADYFPDGYPPPGEREPFYEPTDRGHERRIRERLAHWEALRRKRQRPHD